MSRAAVCGFPYERILYEVCDLCVFKLTLEYVMSLEMERSFATKSPTSYKVCAARYKAYRQGKFDEPTLSECLRACYNTEVHHFYASPDEELKRELGQKCYCILQEEYTLLTGNQLSGSVSR
jgi:hypothetical protein